MLVYIFKRIGLGVLVLILAISSLYILIQAAPGDPASAMLGPRATPALKAAITEKLGLDKPMPVQVFNYLIAVLQGDFGTDLKSKQPVLDTLKIHLPRTLELLGASLFLSAALGIPLGCIAAVRRNSFFDRAVGMLSVSVIAMPAEPSHNSGLRPMRSIRKMVTRQAPMLSPPDSTLISSASLSEKPTACHSTAP